MGLLGKIVKGVVGGALVGITLGAAAPIIGPTFLASVGGSLGLIGGTAFVSAVGGAVVGGLTGVVKGLQKKPKSGVQQDLGSRITVTQDPNAGRSIPYGQVGTAGQLLFKGYNGTDNDTVHMVLALAGCEIDSLVSVKINGKTITLPGSYPYGAITSGNFANKLWIYFHDGRDTTTPFGAGASIHSLAEWNVKTRKLRGIPAVYIKAEVDDDFDGRLEPLFVIKGRKVYDPRLDTTNGGSGSHRVDDESTWAWSANPVLCAHDYALGIRTNGAQVAGIGFSSGQFDYSDIATEADECDESVALNGGGSENRYEANGYVDSRNDHRANLDTLASSMAGRWTFADNKMRFYAGTFKAASIVFDQNDIVGVPSSFRRYRGKRARVNTVRGVFADPNSDYTVQSYPTMQDSTAVTTDGETLFAQLDLPLTTSYTMAQRIAKIFLGRSRAMRAMTATFSHSGINAVPCETASITYPGFGLSTQSMVVNQWDLTTLEDERGNTGLGVVLSFEDEDVSWYTWDETTEEQSFTSPTPLVRQASAYPIESVGGGPELQQDVADAQQAANDAQSDASSALAELADISADGKLTPDEKKAVIREYNALIDEQSGLDARATALAITTEKTNYDNAVSALSSYLGGLSPAWNNTGATTNIARSTWNNTWEDVYTTRQALMNKFVEVAGFDDGEKPENNATKNTNPNNLIKNPNFEEGSLAPHLTLDNGGTWSYGATAGLGGTSAARYATSGQASLATLQTNIRDGVSVETVLPLSSADQVHFDFSVRAEGSPAATNRVRAEIQWRAANGSVVSTSFGDNFTPPTDTSWNVVEVDGVAPAGAVGWNGRIAVVDDGNTCTLDFDRLSGLQKRGSEGLTDGAVTGEKLAPLAVKHENLGIGAALAENLATDGGVNIDVLVNNFAPLYFTEDTTEDTNITTSSGIVVRNETTAKDLDGHAVLCGGNIDLRFTNSSTLGTTQTISAIIQYQVDGGSWQNVTGASVSRSSNGSLSYTTLAFPDKMVTDLTGSVKFRIAVTVTGDDSSHQGAADESVLQCVAMVSK